MKLEDYPAASWRPNQRDYATLVRGICDVPGDVRIGLEGPCGCGKSIGYLRALLDPACPPSMVLTTTRQHLHQLEETLQRYWPDGEGTDWLVLRGRDHYGCCKGPRRAPTDDPDPAEVWAQAPGAQCPLGLKCRYRAAVVQAGSAQVVVQCTIGALYRRQYWSQLPEPAADASPETRELYHARKAILERKMAVLDEAHEYLRVRREFETTRLAVWPATWPRELQDAFAKARQKWGGYKASYVLLRKNQGLGLALECTFRDALKPAALEAMLDQRERAAKSSGREFNRTAEELAFKKQMQDRIDLIQRDATDADGKPIPKLEPCLYVAWDGLKCQLISEPLFVNVKEKLAEKEVFTSATLRDVAALLGIETAQWLHCFPPIFAAEHLSPEPLDDNADGGQKNEPLDADTLAALYHSEGRPLTIVLYLSKKAAHDAARQIATAPGVFVQGLRASQWGDDEEMSLGEMVAKVKEQAHADTPPFLVCYGGWVGTDIPGDKWLVLGQAPKTPLAPYIEARQERRLGGGWNDYEKITLDRLQLAQGIGRAQRTPEDRAVVIWPNNTAFKQLGMNPATGNIR
jgi:Rad3-related DNA helicase